MTKRKKAPKPGGRPTVLTDQVVEDFLVAKRRGGNEEDCAYYAGIHPDTVRRWRVRIANTEAHIHPDTQDLIYDDDGGEPTIPVLFGFFGAVKKATASARLVRLAQIEEASADGTWQAAAWWLERRYPDEYGRRERRDLHVTSGTHGTTGEVDPDDTERLEGIAAVLAAVLDSDEGSGVDDGG